MTPEDRDEAYYPEYGHELMDAEWRAFQAIPDQGFSHRAWIDAKIGQRVQAITADRDMWRGAREDALDELENSDRRGDAILKDLHETRKRLGTAERRLRAALDILDGQFRPTDRIGDLHAAMTSVLRGDL